MHPRAPRIPTIVGILLVLSVIGIIAFFEWFEKSPTSASGSIVPVNIQLTNISDTSFSVVWVTGLPATGVVSVSSGKLAPMTYVDDRDTNGKLNRYTTHMVTVRSLTPSTQYAFRLLSNGKSFTNNGSPYSISTASIIQSGTSGLEPAYGIINDTKGSPLSDAIILLTLEQGQVLSTLTSASGSWLIPLSLARTLLLDRYIDGSERRTETIRVVWNDQEASAITDTLNDSPVPTMVLGKTYDFRKQQAMGKSTPSVLGDTTITKPATAKTIDLHTPAQHASLSTNRPLIQGTGVAGKKVTIVLGIVNPVSGTTTVGADGIWKYSPSVSLPQGKQSVTATTTDQRGKPVAFTHTFTILKSGTQVLGDATPSATLTPTFTPTPIASDQATPTATLPPLPTETLTGEPVPTSGTTLPTFITLIMGFGVLASGIFLFLF